MQIGAITSYIDVAQISLYVFWIFFFGLIYYLRREDKREGYPLVTEQPGELLQGFPFLPTPKVFNLVDGRTVYAPSLTGLEPKYSGYAADDFPGAPLLPIGNAMLSGVGPAAYSLRPEKPDALQENGEVRILPLRLLPGYYVAEDGPNPIGMDVIGADGVVGGVGADLWLDRAEDMVRYIEVTLTGGGNILVPMPLCNVIGGVVNVVSVLGSQFAEAPKHANPDQVTLREEDQIQAYFASGHMYATPARKEPLL
jgi:photosynthetic reaction center H subunit